jgi:hypothetical protein
MSVDTTCAACGTPLQSSSNLHEGGKLYCPSCAGDGEDTRSACTFCAPGSKMIALLQGAVALCPRCGRSFRDEAAAVAQWDAPEAPPRPPAANAAAVPRIESSAAAPSAPADAQAGGLEGVTARPRGVAGQIAALDVPTRIAFFLACWALFVAALPALSGLSKVLSGVGMLAGLWACLGAARPAAARAIPALLALVCLGEFLLAGTWPRVGGRDEASASPALVVARAAPARERPLGDAEWVDAQTEAVQQHDVKVAVTSVRIDALPPRPGVKQVGPAPKYLLISLRVAYLCQDPLQALNYEPWVDLVDMPSRNPPVLVDQQERPYTLVALDPSWSIPGRRRDNALVAGGELRELLVYPLPGADVEYLRLELPAAALGLPGSYRFQIARGMILMQ